MYLKYGYFISHQEVKKVDVEYQMNTVDGN